MNESGEFRVGSRIRPIDVRLETRSQPVTIFVSEIDGLLLFEGDIAVREEILDEVTILGIGITGPSFRWPSATIPFTIQSGNSTTIQEAIAHWAANTPIRLIARSSETHFVTFRSSTGADSEVGRRSGQQFINLPSSATFGTIVHEIGHAVGLWHEHSREDRHQHIEVLTKNIEPGAELNFSQHNADGDDIGSYDFDSIMHYPPDAFGINGAITLRGLHGETFGQRLRLSAGDIDAVRTMYP